MGRALAGARGRGVGNTPPPPSPAARAPAPPPVGVRCDGGGAGGDRGRGGGGPAAGGETLTSRNWGIKKKRWWNSAKSSRLGGIIEPSMAFCDFFSPSRQETLGWRL